MMGKTIAIIVLTVTSIGLAGWVLLTKLQYGDERRVRLHLEAQAGLLFDAAAQGCIPRAAVLKVAEERGWRANDWTLSEDAEDGAASALQVFVKPSHFVGKDPGVFYTFDARGCLLGRSR